MAFYSSPNSKIEIEIPFTERGDGYCLYVIKVGIGSAWWLVKRRYKEFFQLHEEVVSSFGIRKDLIPAKKLLGRNDPEFIEQRRVDLEIYLRQIVQFLAQTLPEALSNFLCMPEYEIYSIVQRLARRFSDKGETIICSQDVVVLDVVELHAIAKRVQTPCSPAELSDTTVHFSNVLDFASQVKRLQVTGSNDFYKNSNLIPNTLSLDFTPFKSLEELTLRNMQTSNISSVSSVRSTLKSCVVEGCQLRSIADFLLCDTVHRDTISVDYQWVLMTSMSLSNNRIESIDKSVELLPKLESLDLSNNQVSSLNKDFLTKLPCLVALSLANNRLTFLDSLHTKVGKITYLNVSQNKLLSLDGLAKLYSIERLDARCNLLRTIEAIACVSNLPCLEHLALSGNPVASVVDYRIKIFSLFGSRLSEVYLDSERAMPKEVDRASVLKALRSAQIVSASNLNTSAIVKRRAATLGDPKTGAIS